jgi:4'-phosphopantetheinyl transferase
VPTVTYRCARVDGAAADLALLDDTERARARRRADPASFVTAHALLRRLVGDHLCRDPREVRFARRCRTCGSDRHGKPVLVDLPRPPHLSLSYDGQWAIAAVCEEAEIGVDIEGIAATSWDAFDRVVLADLERPALAGLDGAQLTRARAILLCRKEAILKATGHGFAVEPVEVIVSAPADPPELREWRSPRRGPAAIRVVDLTLGLSTHVAALAVLIDAPVRAEPG